MRGVNKVILIGTLGRDPEVRYLPQGGAVANLTLATSESWKDKNTGQLQEQTEWHRVVFYGRLAEVAGQYLRKGSKAFVEGSLHTRKWQDKQTGQDRYSTEIKGESLQMLDSRPAHHGPDDAAPAPAPRQPAYAPQPAPAYGGGALDDDIPFAARSWIEG